MRSLSIREAREHLATIEDLVAREGELIITRRGKAVARILPVGCERRVPQRKALRDSIRPLTVSSEVLVRGERDER